MKSDRQKADPPPPQTGVELSGLDSLKALWRIRPFRRLWLVLGLSSMGDWLGLLASAIFASPQVSGAAAEGVARGSGGVGGGLGERVRGLVAEGVDAW